MSDYEDLLSRLHDALGATDLDDLLEEAHAAISRLSAGASEAETQIPEPLFVGTVYEAYDHGGAVVHVAGDYTPAARDIKIYGSEVAIYPADLAEKAADQALDREGTERELEAMTAVARKFERGWWARTLVTPQMWMSTEGPEHEITDAERQALKTLGVGDDE